MTTTSKVNIHAALTYEAPFLIEKLVKEHIVETPEEAHGLFTEVKRYLVAAHSVVADAPQCSMYSVRIDEAWHQFVLFTREYVGFCMSTFGKYIHHNPSNAPKHEHEPEDEPLMSFEAFKAHYEALFCVSLPDAWYDERSVTPRMRIARGRTSMQIMRAEDGMVDVRDAKGEVLLSVNEIALPALAFLAQTPTFFVRELPGDLTDDEKVGLVSTLVEYRLLRVAA